jgi:hypothetical protein
MSTQWMVEEHEPGWIGRLIAPSDGGRPATAAVVVGVLAAVAFALSLAFNWGTVTIDEGAFQGAQQPSEYTAGVTNMISLSFVYLIGNVALLGIVGAVVTTPELALKLRLAAIGVTAGLVAVVIAATVQMPTVATLGIPGQYETKSAIEVGLFFGYAAAVLPLAAVWLAARPAAQARPPSPAHAEPEATEEDEPPVVPFPRGLSVSGGPLDLTVTPG